MNSSDDPFDKKLRKHFQDAFDDFEVQPSASLKERIWQHIAKPILTHRQYGPLAFGLLLLIGMGFFYQEYDSRLRSYQIKSRQPRLVVTSAPAKSDLQGVTKAPPSTHYSHRFTDETNPVSETVRLSNERKRTGAGQQLTSRISKPFGNVVSENRQEERSRMANQRSRPGHGLAFLSTAAFDDNLTQPRITVAKSPTLRTDTSELILSTPSVHVVNNEKVISEGAISWQSLRSLSLHPVSDLSTQINRKIDVPVRSVATEQPIKSNLPVRWLLGVAPLSTYQLMTVVDKPDTYVQRVDVPSAFSGATWGYQLRAGIEWRNYDVELSFGQIRRWAYYDLATNAFQVQPIGANKYEVTRLEQPVAENVSLSMMGASLNKQYKLGGARSPYFARLGGAVSYVPDTRQSLIWAKATVGATLPLLKDYQLQVGPTVEYGFSRIWSTERQLIIRPYLVGASITIRPTKP